MAPAVMDPVTRGKASRHCEYPAGNIRTAEEHRLYILETLWERYSVLATRSVESSNGSEAGTKANEHGNKKFAANRRNATLRKCITLATQCLLGYSFVVDGYEIYAFNNLFQERSIDFTDAFHFVSFRKQSVIATCGRQSDTVINLEGHAHIPHFGENDG